MRVRDEQTRSEPAGRRSKLGPGDPVLALQRSAGNRAVGALLARQPVETSSRARS
jgi:hypothetical protein